jgi:hypothetical protein
MRVQNLFPAVFIAVACISFTGCDKLLPGANTASQKKSQKNESPTEEKLTPEQMELRFKTARVQLLNGKVQESIEGLNALASRKDVPQPLASWVRMYQGLALLLSGKLDEARSAYNELAEKKWESNEPSEAKISAFLVKAGRILGADGPIPPTAAKEFDRSTHESLALLSCGIKNWSLNKMEEAEPFLRNFAASYIRASEAWIGTEADIKKMQSLASNIEESQSAYGIVLKDLEGAKTPEEKVEAVRKARLAMPQLKFTPKLMEDINLLVAKIEPEAIAMIEKVKSEMAAAEQFDAKAWPEAREKCHRLLAEFKFELARETALKPELKTEKFKEPQENAGKRYQWLATFKEVLTDDLKSKGYKDPVKRKDGSTLAGGIAKADDDQVTFKTQPPTSVPWGDLSPESIVSIAQSFIPEDMAPFLAAHRRWQLGVFFVFIGKPDEAKPLLTKASQANPVYVAEIEPLLQSEGF